MQFTCSLESDTEVMAGVWLEFADYYDWPTELHYIPEAAKPDTWAAWVEEHGWLWLFYSIPDGRLGGYALAAPVCDERAWLHFGILPWVPVKAAVRAGREWIETVFRPVAPAAAYIMTKSFSAAKFARLLGIKVTENGGVYHGWWRQTSYTKGAASRASCETGGRGSSGGKGQGAPAPADAVQPREHVYVPHADCGIPWREDGAGVGARGNGNRQAVSSDVREAGRATRQLRQSVPGSGPVLPAA